MFSNLNDFSLSFFVFKFLNEINIKLQTMQKKFKEYLRRKNLASNTIRSYSATVERFHFFYKSISNANLLSYKEYCVAHYKPASVNIQIHALNQYLEFRGKSDLKLKTVKVQQQRFLENVISNEDYQYFKSRMRKDGRMKWYFMVWFMAATGARISELLQIKMEHVQAGFIDLYTKGGKIRRIYIPKKLATAALEWLQDQKINSGFIFLNRWGRLISREGIATRLRKYAIEYGIDPKVVYPHSFRHLFAKNFLAKHNDIALLADLMGHESIETTRIYLRMTAGEQHNIVNKVVTW